MEKEKLNFNEKLSEIQNELKAPKGQYNNFGNYKYRSAEDILESVKPICKKFRTVLTLSDVIKQVGDRYYVEATATLCDLDSDKFNITTASAREEESKKGMDGSQITGTASSYARKYALNGLFNIDDTKDADTDEYQKQTSKQEKQNITLEEAKQYKLTFGKYKNSTLEDIFCDDPNYLDWLYKNDKTDDIIKKYLEVINNEWTDDTTPYDFLSDMEKMRLEPINEGQKQRIATYKEEDIKTYLKQLKKRKLSDLTWGEAHDFMEKQDKNKEEVF